MIIVMKFSKSLLTFFFISACLFEHVWNCEEGWIRYKHKCFKYLPNKVNYENAINLCNMLNSTMVSVNSFDELTFLEDIARHYSTISGVHWVWLGGVRNANGNFSWQDQSNFNFTRWRYNCPDSRKGEDCILMSVFQAKPSHWCNYGCNLNYDHVICQRYYQAPAPPSDSLIVPVNESVSHAVENGESEETGPTVYACELGWTLNEGNCYRLIEQNETWHSALHLCQTLHNGSLASVTSEAEQMFLASFLFAIHEPNEAVWIGGIRAQPGDLAQVKPLGKQENISTSNQFIWIDGQPFTYENYATHEPDNRGGNEACLAMNNIEEYMGQWLDAPCNVNFAVACKRPAHRIPFMGSMWSEDNSLNVALQLSGLLDAFMARLSGHLQPIRKLSELDEYIRSDNLTRRFAQFINGHTIRPSMARLSSESHVMYDSSQVGRWLRLCLVLSSLACAALLCGVGLIAYGWLRPRWTNGPSKPYSSIFSFRNLSYEEKSQLAANDYEELTYGQPATSNVLRCSNNQVSQLESLH